MFSRSHEVLALAMYLLVPGYLGQSKLKLSGHLSKIMTMWCTRDVPVVAPVLPKTICCQYLRSSTNSIFTSGLASVSCVRVCLKTLHILFSFKRIGFFLIIAPEGGGGDSGRGNVAQC